MVLDRLTHKAYDERRPQTSRRFDGVIVTTEDRLSSLDRSFDLRQFLSEFVRHRFSCRLRRRPGAAPIA
jgi:hypothetical protein